MALGQRRMLYTNLWQNIDFAKLSDKAKLLYIGIITIADDDGRLKGNSLLLRGMVFPLDEKITAEDVRKWLNEIVRAKLVTFYKYGTEYFIQHPNWKKYQSIRSDMYKQSDIPPPVTKPLRTRYSKLSKDKISKERARASIDFLWKLPDDVLDELHKRFDASKQAIVSKAEDLALWCESNGKMKKNYNAFLLNALKKDFPERKPTQKPAPVVPEEEIDRENVKAQLRKTRETLGFQKPMGVGEEKIANVGQ